MSSRGTATFAKRDLSNEALVPAKSVREFRSLLKAALTATDGTGLPHGKCKWGVYAFYDYEDEPIYVGQTTEGLSTRVRRHLTNQRTDAVAMRILDTFEVAGIELWPLWDLAREAKAAAISKDQKKQKLARIQLDALEYSAYIKAIEKSQYRAILNEKIPPQSSQVDLPPSFRFPLITETTREERGHPDVRIARRAETISRLAAVAHERGEVSDGLRRVLVIQAIRLTHLAAMRLARAEGRETPDADAISVERLVGDVTIAKPDSEIESDNLELGLDGN